MYLVMESHKIEWYTNGFLDYSIESDNELATYLTSVLALVHVLGPNFYPWLDESFSHLHCVDSEHVASFIYPL